MDKKTGLIWTCVISIGAPLMFWLGFLLESKAIILIGAIAMTIICLDSIRRFLLFVNFVESFSSEFAKEFIESLIEGIEEETE